MQPNEGSRYLSGYYLCSPAISPSCRSDVISTRAFFVKAISLYLSVNVFLGVSGVKSHHIKVYLLHKVKLLLVTLAVLVSECADNYLKLRICSSMYLYFCVFVLFIIVLLLLFIIKFSDMNVYLLTLDVAPNPLLYYLVFVTWIEKYTAGNSILHCWVIINYRFV